MEPKKVFEETYNLEKEINKYQKLLDSLYAKDAEMMKSCQHEIVFKYHDNHPRKMVIEGNYFCPACGKTIMCYNQNQINDTVFKNSKIIPLTDLSLIIDDEVYKAVREEVYSNIDLYYSDDVDTSELSFRMQEKLKDYEYDYFDNQKVLRK